MYIAVEWAQACKFSFVTHYWPKILRLCVVAIADV